MKLAPLLALLFFPLSAFASDTAYQALRIIGTERDKAILEKIVEVKGRAGTPQPARWLVTLDDPFARGGIREIEVSAGKISSERTPVNPGKAKSGQGLMNLSKLNLDSTGAFSVAEEAAATAKTAFDAVDYQLTCPNPTAAPVWTLELLDGQRRSVGILTVSADNGTVLFKAFGKNLKRSRATVTEPFIQGSTPSANPTASTARSGEDDTPPSAREEGFGHKVNRSFHRAGATLEEFFTGERTIDRRFRDE